MPWGMLAAGVAKLGLGAYAKKKETDASRKQFDTAIAGLEDSKALIPAQNRQAYNQAIFWMLGNRRDPNAWNFAASTYGNKVAGNMQRGQKLVEGIAQLQSQEPGSYNLGTALADAGLEGLNMMMFKNMMGENNNEQPFNPFAFLNKYKKPATVATPQEMSDGGYYK